MMIGDMTRLEQKITGEKFQSIDSFSILRIKIKDAIMPCHHCQQDVESAAESLMPLSHIVVDEEYFFLSTRFTEC
jgi:hypothetical protein